MKQDKDEKNVKISIEAHQKLKVYCAEHQINLKDFATQMVMEYLEQQQKKEKKKKPTN